MSVISVGIGGLELAQVPPAGTTTIGYLQAGNGYATADLTAGAARSGNFGLNSNTAALSHHAVWQPILANTSLPGGTTAWEARYRFFYRVQTFPSANNVTIFGAESGVTPPSLFIQMNTTGQLRILPSFCGNTTSAYAGSFSTNVWYRVQVRLFGTGSGSTADAGRDSSCSIEIYNEAGDTLITSFTDSLNSGENMPTVWPSLVFMGQNATVGTATARHIQFDDLWWKWATDTDVADLEWPRATKIYLFKPNGVGSSTQYTRGGTDTGANWSQVNDVPLSGTSDVRTSTVGNTDMYTHEPGNTDEVVYHIRAAGFWSDDSSLAQTIFIGADSFDCAAAIGAQFGLADKAYTNSTYIDKTTFDAKEIGFKKKQGGGTMFVANFFLEVLSGPPPIFLDDLPPAGDPTQWTVTAAYDTIGGLEYSGDSMSLTFATGTLGFRLGNQGVEINVPTTWRVLGIDVGYRDEQTS